MAAIPVTVLTGFLGSGKTTLLKRLLESPRLSKVAVIVNEFGEIGLDHLLVRRVDESTVILKSGCICCTVRGDLIDSLKDLLSQRERRRIPQFDRVAVETTGLADPVPIAYTLANDPVLKHHFRLGGIVSTVDAVNGLGSLRRHPETVKQAATADRLVVTKTDLAKPAAIGRLEARLTRLNPAAPIVEAGAFRAEMLLAADLHDPKARSAEVRRWFADEARHGADDHGHASRHADDIRSFALVVDKPLDWAAFGLWLTMLLDAHGQDVLRVKGILNVAGSKTPVVINAVQHLVHPPIHLEAWPDRDRRSRLVFIVKRLDEARLRASLAVFVRLAISPRRRARGARSARLSPAPRSRRASRSGQRARSAPRSSP